MPVVKVKSDKYTIAGHSKGNDPKRLAEVEETNISLIQKLIASGEFTAEYIPATFTSHSRGTLIIEEKV